MVDEICRGMPVVGVELKLNEGRSETIYFDSARGYAPVRFVQKIWSQANEGLVDELAESKPGVFYPRKGEYRTTEKGKPLYLLKYCASGIAVNDPDLRDSVFNIDWPVGTKIWNKVSDQFFTVSQGEDSIKRIEAEVLKAQQDVAAAEAKVSMSVEELCRHLKENEGKLLNVRVTAQNRFEEDQGARGWQIVNEGELTAWLEARPGGKFKTDCPREVTCEYGPNRNISSNSSTTSTVRAWNGRVGKMLERFRDGSPQQGWIDSERQFFSDVATGWMMTSPGIAENLAHWEYKPLSAVVESIAKDRHRTVRLLDDQFQGTRVIRIEVKRDDSDMQTVVYVDPARGYTPVKVTYHYWGGMISEVEAEELAEVKPGVYYPRKTKGRNVHGERPDVRSFYCASEIVVNDPDMQDSVFDLDWPDKTRVDDKISGFEFKVTRHDDAVVKRKAEGSLPARQAGETVPLVCMTNYARITIEEYNGTNEVLVIPRTIDSLPVTGIGGVRCTNVTSVTIPREVTNIEEGAFNRCGRLTAIAVDASNASYSSVDGVLLNKEQTELVQCPEGKTGTYTVPQSVTKIGNRAFRRCGRLTSVAICSNVTSIGSEAFCGCGLTNIMIGASVTNIGGRAFADCDDLTDLTIPASVTSLGDGAFRGCEWLKSVSFKGNAPRLGHDVFDDDSEAVVYYERGTKGWRSDFGGRPTDLVWDPEAAVK